MIISKTHTLDGVEVVPGLRVWDYDLNVRVVGSIAYREGTTKDDPLGDPWFHMINPETMARGSDMNPSRMWFYHPSTQRKA
jgi:hypothetical protein